MYIALHPFFDPDKIQLKYARTELVDSVSEIRHPIFREVLAMYGLKGVDLNAIADIPSGTGLGSSSSFTVGLLNAVNAYRGHAMSSEKLGRLASEIEIDRLGSPIGKQDQYAAAYGGLNFITFYPDDTVNVEKIVMDSSVKKTLEKNLLMVYAGGSHSADAILGEQAKAISEADKFAVQREMVQLTRQLRVSLENNSIDDFGRFLHEGWLLKRSLTKSITTTLVDELYALGLQAGALGGKLLGAGGGGFLLFYCPEERQSFFRRQMAGWREVFFSFDPYGSKIIYISDK